MRSSTEPREENPKAKLVAVLVVLASFLHVAPVIESGSQIPVSIFHAGGDPDSRGL